MSNKTGTTNFIDFSAPGDLRVTAEIVEPRGNGLSRLDCLSKDYHVRVRTTQPYLFLSRSDFMALVTFLNKMEEELRSKPTPEKTL